MREAEELILIILVIMKHNNGFELSKCQGLLQILNV